MHNQASIFRLLLCLTLVVGCTGNAVSARMNTPASLEGEKLGKIFIKAALTEINGQQFPDADLEETVKDMTKRPGKFIVVSKESEAEYLLVIVERKAVAVSGQAAVKSIIATLSVRNGSEWKPATKLQSGVRRIFWAIAADDVIKDAEKWVKANVKA